MTATLTEQAAAALVDSEAAEIRAARIAELMAESEERAAAEAAERERAAQHDRDLRALDKARVERMRVDAEGDVVLTALADWVTRSEAAAAAHTDAATRVGVPTMPWNRRELFAVEFALGRMSRDLHRELGVSLREVRLSDPL